MSRGRGFEATPLLIDGFLFITGTNNWAWAIDAKKGKQIWQYRRQLPTGLTYGGGNIVNRGFGMLGNSLFMATLDAHLIALDRNNGNVLWDTTSQTSSRGTPQRFASRRQRQSHCREFRRGYAHEGIHRCL